MDLIAIACDQAGFDLKNEILKHMKTKGYTCKDFGTYSCDAVDYPDYAKKAVQAILSGECTKGILICGTGIGISITANRYKGIRAALCHDVFSAKATRQHNDANILAVGARVIGTGLCMEIVDAFFDTPFSGEERHIKRIKKIDLSD